MFEALTGAAADELIRVYKQVHVEFKNLPPGRQPGELETITDENIPWMINYIYDHFEQFKLLLCCNAPGAADAFFDELAKIEEQSCRDFVQAMESLGYQVPELKDALLHIICRSFFQQIQEFVSHDVPREDALYCALILGRFQHAGWKKMLHLDS